jgi:predicted RND superfamily exporter protein
MLQGLVNRIVDLSGRRPVLVVISSLLVIAAMWTYASRIEVRSDLLELLPRDSPGFRAYEHQLGRVGGGASLFVLVKSGQPEQSKRFVDELAKRVRDDAERRKSAGLPTLVSYVESDTVAVRTFFEQHRWLYVDLDDLTAADEKLDLAIAQRAGLVEDLDAPSDAASETKAPGESALEGALSQYEERWQKAIARFDDSNEGYFATPDRSIYGIRIVSLTSGTGDRAGAALLDEVAEDVRQLDPARYDPGMVIGYAGDIPNAIAEQKSLVSDALLATGVALVLIFAGVAFFYRSGWPLIIIILPALFGVGAAYAFATLVFGYVNTTGAFLGAIILGNGINYPIVLLSRYREFRARGQAPAEARREAVRNAFRAELVGASVASIAYGSLTITHFRGFSQFGIIGFVGMLLVWASVIPIVPAMVALIELGESRGILRQRILPAREGTIVTRAAARWTEARPRWFVGGAVLLSVAAAAVLPNYLRDPWEYNFDKLGSRGSKEVGAGLWSNEAERVFGGKTNIAGALMLADRPEQVPNVKQAILAKDALDPEGRLIADVVTIDDFLPGTPAQQAAKLAVLARIRNRITPRLLAHLSEADRKRAEKLKPPDTLHILTAADLPVALKSRFEERTGTLGTVFYVKYRDVSLSDGHNLLRIAKTTDNVTLDDGTIVQTASRATVFSEMIRSMERDGPLATAASFAAVLIVVLLSTHTRLGALAVVSALLMGVLWMVGLAAATDHKLNFLNFIALPITFGIGCEYPFNIYDRSRLLKGDATRAVLLSGGAVALCSYTTTVGYGSLLFSDNQALQSFGWLAISGEIACVSTALLIVPSLLHLFNRRSPPDAHAEASPDAAAKDVTSREGGEPLPPRSETRDPPLGDAQA